jgi:two-component system chemotaxis response regulator CheB
LSRKPVRVLLVDDSPLALVLLQRMLATSAEIEVVGVATHGRQALDLIPHLQPAVICTDYHMPDMNGLQLIRKVMEHFPCPILVVSSAVNETDSERIFALLEAGAVDVFPKPRGGPDADASAAELLVNKIKVVAGVRVFGRKQKSALSTLRQPSILPVPRGKPRPIKIVAIGASTGGPQALQKILSELPRDFPAPILCVQHISIGFLPGLVSWLGAHFRGKVQIARDCESPRPGHVYFPQENTHLLVDDQDRLRLSQAPPVGGHRPSVSATFRSVAAHYGETAVGVLLTGMGRDGGDGMRTLADAGALTICQDEATCVIYGMPRDAVERGAARTVLPIGEIAGALIAAVESAAPTSSEKVKHGSS